MAISYWVFIKSQAKTWPVYYLLYYFVCPNRIFFVNWTCDNPARVFLLVWFSFLALLVLGLIILCCHGNYMISWRYVQELKTRKGFQSIKISHARVNDRYGIRYLRFTRYSWIEDITAFSTCWYFELMPKWTQFMACQRFRPFLFYMGVLSNWLDKNPIRNKNTPTG